jgi:hypothetical protein
MTDDRCRDVIVQHWTTINGVPLERRIQVEFSVVLLGSCLQRWAGPLQRKLLYNHFQDEWIGRRGRWRRLWVRCR